MARWITLNKKEGDQVFFADGTPFAVGQRARMGLGEIELRNTKKAGLHVVRLSGSGHFSYSLKLTREGEYRLGPSYGHRVRTPEEETDPIKRILREMGIPISQLRRMEEGEPLETSEYSCDIWRAYPHGTSTHRWETDGKIEVVTEDRRSMRHVNQYCGDEISRTVRIREATYAISSGSYVQMNSAIVTRLWEVVVWPNCDPTTLANALASIVYGDGADAEYVEVLENFEAARRWVAKKFEIAPHRERRGVRAV